MLPAAEDNCGDSAGVPWEGRSFEANSYASDDGSADENLAAALAGFHAGAGNIVDIVDAYRSARLLIPLVAEKGEEGVAPSGLRVDKTQELSIVSVAAPDGRSVMPVFTCVDTMRTWDSQARPVPADGRRTAVAAVHEETDLIVIDPGSASETVLRRPAVWAIAHGEQWQPSFESPAVFTGLQESIAAELSVIDLTVSPGDPRGRLHGSELVVSLELVEGLSSQQLDAVLSRLAQRWSTDDRIATLVDSLQVTLRRSV